MKSFASDNCSGVHSKVLDAIVRANQGAVPSYGADEWTASAISKFQDQFGEAARVFFVFNGTAANVLGLKTMVQPFHAIVCAETAHIATKECGAPEQFIGCKLITVPTPDGKLTVDLLESYCIQSGNIHEVQPRVISITQTSELGTVYTADEIKTISDFAHSRGMYLHMDGARISNAAAALNTSLRAITVDSGVDVLSFGGTKNGLLFGEAIIFFNPEFAKNFEYYQKQGMQLASKMRFVAAQFEAFLTDDLWRTCAGHANQMAKKLHHQLKQISGVRITQQVQSNAVLVSLPPSAVEALRKKFHFYVINKKNSEIRCMTSFDTTEESILEFAKAIRDQV